MRKIFLLAAMLLTYGICFAQDDPGGNPDASTPIDGGVAVFVAAGIGYGVKKLKDSKHKKNEQ